MVTTTIKLSLIVIVWLIGLSVIEVKATNKLKGLMSTDEYKDLQAELVYTDKFTQDQLKNYKSERGNQG